MRLQLLRRLVTVILSALLLSVAAPLLAQATPTPAPWPTVASPAISFNNDEAVTLLGQPGVVHLTVNFTTLEAPDALGYTRLVLRTVDADAYRVLESRIDNQPAAVSPTADQTGYMWPLPPDAGTHSLTATLQMLRPVAPTTIALVVLNADGSNAALAYLSEATVAQLAAAQQQAATPTLTPTNTPESTPTAATVTLLTDTPKPPPGTLQPTITVAAPTTPTTAPVVPAATAPDATVTNATAPAATATAPAATATSDDNSRLVPLLLGGLFLLAALAIGALLLMRRRRPPRVSVAPPAVGRPVTVPLPPVGAEMMTGVLIPVYLELEGDAPQVFPVNETPFTIGRDPDNSLPIDETIPGWQTVSREHALISRHERGYVIEDLGSQNGVRVNGRLTPKNLLRNGWQVTIGGVTFRFVDETQTN